MSELDYGLIGTGVMGSNLALNILDHGFTVAAYNRERPDLDRTVEQSGGRLVAADDLPGLVGHLSRPRKLFMMIKAGAPVDQVLEALLPHLEAGDIVIDGGNSWFEDTQRRERHAAATGVRFFGIGVSGGAEGARHGPSLMPGGDAEGYAQLKPMLEAIAAKTDSGPCVTHVGPDGAGHFVKMVHNGIEYADMQVIAEGYDLLQRVLGLEAGAIAEVFRGYDEGPLQSFLVEITAKILAKVEDGAAVVDHVLDKAGQKGTGRWTASMAIDLGVPVPTICAAVDARVLSSRHGARRRASTLLAGPSATPPAPDRRAFVATLEGALEAAKIAAYAQGLDLIGAGSTEHQWEIDVSEIARIWKGGCIIRARLLDTIMRAYAASPPENLLLADAMRERLAQCVPQLRLVVSTAAAHGVPVLGLASALGYIDSYRTARLPQNLTQAQRDAFGAHTYQRLDDPDGPFVHTDWLGGDA